MITQHNGSSERQERLQEILLGYVEAAEAGKTPDRKAFLAAFPEFTDDIVEFLANYEQVQRLGAPVRGAMALQGIPPRTAIGASAKQSAAVTEPGAGAAASPVELGLLGDFRLLRELGRGGMGVVYEAEQISLRRRVALKVLPFAAGVDSRQLQRFRNEAEAAAHLHHSHIVPVFAVGTERGVHYYAMQLIDGQSLASLITQLGNYDVSKGTRPDLHVHEERGRGEDVPDAIAGAFAEKPFVAASLTRPLAAQPLTSASLTTEHSTRSRAFYRSVAGIARQAAEALEYAHQMGVVHRDIKPANLLLDDRGQLWIADFGLAQFQTQAGLTMTGELLGTLRYVSPEQAMAKRGLVDHRTDIYSLGATLYELLTLEPVFDGKDRHALLHQIGFDEPRPPRAIEPAIPVELETIVLKALAKNPPERYGTAQELADDLQRFLKDEPILAKRPGLVERSRKWMRRHPSIVAAAMMLLGFGAIGFAVSTALIAREQAGTRAALEREKQRSEEAEQRFQLAKRSADEMILVAEEELADHPAMHNLRRRLLESALAYYQEFIEQRRDVAELADTRDKVKKILDDLAVLQGTGQLFMLKNPAVLAEIQVDGDQRVQVDEFWREMDRQRHESFRDFHRLTPEARKRRFVELARGNETTIAAILSKEQLQRFRQIVLQAQGPMAFRDADVVAALKLTAKQRKDIRAIESEMHLGSPDERPGNPKGGKAGGRPGPAPWKAHVERRATDMKRIEGLLTPNQLKTWRALIGTPINISWPMFMPGPPPDGPGGPRGFGGIFK
ncbi:MAG: serine/threonine protein kinase [Planctomycetes bacterium]|nr:serine/threonine protein kinase [Planctomycetota bacterium]